MRNLTNALLLVAAFAVIAPSPSQAAWPPPPFTTACGSVLVVLSPDAARPGSKWRVVAASGDVGAWKASGEIASDIPAGLAAIELQPAAGWAAPVAAPTALVVGGQEARTDVTLAQVAAFKLGEITPQSYRLGGNGVTFSVYAATMPCDARFSAVAAPAPKGPLAIDASTGRFSYKPDSADTAAFTVAFKASRGGQADETQTVAFTPWITPPAETSVFFTQSALPDSASSDYLSVTVQTDLVDGSLNYRTAKLRKVDVAGINVVIDTAAAAKNSVYDTFNSDGVKNLDIKELNIYADTVVIRRKFHLPQTKVAVYARTLSFEDSSGEIACLDTTPLSLPPAANCTGSMAKGDDGLDGLKGGPITLQLQSLLVKANLWDPRFITRGSGGQQGGEGMPGADGRSMQPLTKQGQTWEDFKAKAGSLWEWNARMMYDRDGNMINWDNVVYGVIYWGWGGVTKCPLDVEAETSWPESGTNAKSPGTSGKGGDGGDLSANINIRLFRQCGAGVAGHSAPTAQGGRAGTPTTVLKYKRDHGVDGFTLMESRATTAGTTYYGRRGANGMRGEFQTLGNGYSWLQPQALRALAVYFRDAFAANRAKEVYPTLSYYAALLRSYTDDATLFTNNSDLSVEWKMDILQAREDFAALANRALNGLDFFGHQPGWSPMLSFEVTYTAFSNEVDSALNAMYLSYWISKAGKTNAQRKSALNQMIDNNVAEVKSLAANYGTANQEMAKLYPQIDAVILSTRIAQDSLRELDAQLLRQADENVNPLWKKLTSGILKVVGAVVSCIPSPKAQVAGALLSAGGDAVESLNPANNFANTDWATVVDKGVGGFGDALAAVAGFKDAQTKDKLDLSMAQFTKEERADYTKQHNVASFLGQLGKGVKSTSSAAATLGRNMTGSQVDSKEVREELERLRSLSPAYTTVKENIQKLMDTRESLAATLQERLNQLNAIPGEVMSRTAAIDSMQDMLAKTSDAFDPRVESYLKDMDKRARLRLQGYQYLMAKAYEYRMLQPYSWDLNLDPLFEKFKSVAQGSSDAILTKEQFTALKAVYTEQLSSVAQSILTAYTENQPATKTDVSMALSAAEVAYINSMGVDSSFELNFYDRGLFASNEEDIRVKNIKAAVMTMHREGPDASSATVCNITFKLVHSGVSRFQKDGKTREFFLYTDQTSSPIKWDIKYDDMNPVKVRLTAPSPSAESLLKTLLGGGGTASNLELFCYPSADATVTLFKGQMVNGGADVKLVLDSLTLVFDYEYTERSAAYSVVEAAVVGDLSPMFVVGTADSSGLKDGVKRLRRGYRSSSGQTTIAAPASCGGYDFVNWTDFGGKEVTKSTTLTVALNQKYQLFLANYASYSIAGQITTKESVDPGNLPIVNVSVAGAKAASTKMLSDGSYFVDGLPPGSYTITPSLADVSFSPDSRTVEVKWGQSSPASLNFEAVYTACSISGTITGDAAAATLLLKKGSSVVSQVALGADGKYQFKAMPSGDYTVVPAKAATVFNPASRSVSVSAAAPVAAGVDFAATALATYTLSGKVTGLGASGVAVSVTKDNVEVAKATSGSDGAYAAGGLLPGVYGVLPARTGYDFDPPNDSVEIVDADLSGVDFSSKQQLFAICGLVRDASGAGVQGVTLSARKNRVLAAEAKSAADGSFTIPNLSPGLFAVTPTKAGQSFAPRLQSVKIESSDVAGKNFTATTVGVPGDFTGSKKSSILATNATDNGVYAGSGDNDQAARLYPLGAKTAPSGRKATPGEWAEGVMDFVGGGAQWEMLTAANFTGGATSQSLWRHTGTGQSFLYYDDWPNLFPVSQPGKPWLKPAFAADYDGDGKADLLWRDSRTGELFVDTLLDGRCGVGAYPLAGSGLGWDVVAVADFDGDGKADLLWDNQETGALRVSLLSKGSVVGGGMVLTSRDLDWEVADAVDFDHDGKAEILWRVKSTGAVYIDPDLRDGKLDTSFPVHAGGDPAWDVVNTGDYDGDGNMDVLMINDSSRTVLVHYLNGLDVRESLDIPLTDDPKWDLIR